MFLLLLLLLPCAISAPIRAVADMDLSQEHSQYWLSNAQMDWSAWPRHQDYPRFSRIPVGWNWQGQPHLSDQKARAEPEVEGYIVGDGIVGRFLAYVLLFSSVSGYVH